MQAARRWAESAAISGYKFTPKTGWTEDPEVQPGLPETGCCWTSGSRLPAGDALPSPQARPRGGWAVRTVVPVEGVDWSALRPQRLPVARAHLRVSLRIPAKGWLQRLVGPDGSSKTTLRLIFPGLVKGDGSLQNYSGWTLAQTTGHYRTDQLHAAGKFRTLREPDGKSPDLT